MIRLTKEQVLSIYGMLIKKTGGSSGVLNESSIDSALNNIWQTFDGLELYPTLAEKGARLGYSLVRNHSFSDGNKRIAAALFLYFLDKNNALFIDGKKVIDDYTLVAVTIMTAESKPDEKDTMIKLIMNFLS